MKLYASYRAENLSIRIKTITPIVWNHSKPFKIAYNISFHNKMASINTFFSKIVTNISPVPLDSKFYGETYF